MARKLILSGFMSALLLASVIAYSLPAFAQGPDSAGKSQVVYAFGEIPGKNIIVHVAVIVPPGLDKNEVINQALNYQGAKKIEKSEYSLLSSLKWNLDQPGGNPVVVIKYNDANEPNVIPDESGEGLQIFDAVLAEWNSVEYSTFSFIGGETEKCPSLTKECGSTADGENSFGWAEIKQPHTLGVTYWKNTEDGLEADVLLSTNKKISWNTNGGNYDIFTVALHELGHELGLGHSEVREAVMYPSYQKPLTGLYQDDICGVQDLFGTDSDDACSATTTTTTTGSGEVTDIDITFKNNRNGLRVTLDLTDDQGNPVNTTIEITLKNDGESAGTGSATTGDDGSVTFVKRAASSGCYTISIDSVGGSTYGGNINTDPNKYPFCI